MRVSLGAAARHAVRVRPRFAAGAGDTEASVDRGMAFAFSQSLNFR
jgi:hypothetical protein